MVNKYGRQRNIFGNRELNGETELVYEAFDGPLQLVEMVDHPVRLELCYGNFGIAKGDADDGNSGTAGHADIGTGISHHDHRRHLAAGARYRLPQNGGVRLG